MLIQQASPYSNAPLSAVATQMEQFFLQRPYILPYAGSSSSNAPPGNHSTLLILDSGATHHMTHDRSLFSCLTCPSSAISVLAANGSSMSLAGVGSISTPHLSLSDVYFLPQLTFFKSNFRF